MDDVVHSSMHMLFYYIFYFRADATFPLSPPFFFSHRKDTLVQQVNLSLIPQSELQALWRHDSVILEGAK